MTAVYSGDSEFGGSQSGTNAGSIITTVAGGGLGNGGPATAAPVDIPFGLAIDSDGNLFLAETATTGFAK